MNMSLENCSLRRWSNASGALVVAVGLLLVTAGCKSVANDPPSPRPGFGYVDFYSEEEPGTMSWDILRYDPEAKHFKILFSEVNPVKSRVVRVALPPGEHMLSVGFLNESVQLPAKLNLSVRESQVIPVKVTLSAGEVGVYQMREQRYGPTARGHYGRTIATRSMTGKASKVTAEPLSPLDYRPSAQMPYAKAPVKAPAP
jgi:hypothetical protein